MSRKTLQILSLFSGCGGLDLGFLQAGFNIQAAFDIDRDAAATYRDNIGQCETTDLSDWRRVAQTVGNVDVVVGGPPCQGFSVAGPRRLDDPRNTLLAVPARIAIAVKANAVVIENVLGVLAQPHRQFWNEVDTMLRAAGYFTETLILDAATLGLAQVRKRVFLVATRMPLNDVRIHPVQPPAPLKSVFPVKAGAPNHQPVWLDSFSDDYRIACRIEPGQKLCNVRSGPASVHTWDIPEVFGDVTPIERRILEFALHRRRTKRIRTTGDADPIPMNEFRAQFGVTARSHLRTLREKGYIRVYDGGRVDLTHTFNGKFRRLDPDRPAHCVLTGFCDPKYFLHPYEHRALSVREAARLQSFPDTFVFTGSSRSQARQVGNAVPPEQARVVAMRLRANLLGHAISFQRRR
jgi:DNA (cytosine-5)-methyltransferase 1